MTVLCDTTISARIGRGELIIGGDPVFARGCSYEFKAARVVYGGTDPLLHQVSAVDLMANGATTAIIKPSGVAWVRSREQVRIPPDMVGVWVQTNSLSRSGLLLLNSTLVEPGYEGHLAAHFVNLGATDVLLSARTTIAKLLFVQLDGNAHELLDSRPYTHYDEMIDGLAARSHKSFLRIGELVPDIAKATSNAVNEAEKEIAEKVTKSIKTAEEELASFEKKTLRRVGGGFALGLVLAVAFATWIYPIMRDVDAESTARIAAVVREQNAALIERLNQVQQQLKRVADEQSPATQSAASHAAKNNATK